MLNSLIAHYEYVHGNASGREVLYSCFFMYMLSLFKWKLIDSLNLNMHSTSQEYFI